VDATDLLNTPVADVLAAGERAVQVFLERRMGCPGCPFAPFETVQEVADIYGANAQELADALLGAGAWPPGANGAKGRIL
jgi:hybrid cluster-associated redox disulfide protein